MSCHNTCLTCTGPLFDQCTSCFLNMTLISGVCYCNDYLDTQCVYRLPINLLSATNFLSSAIGLSLAALLILYFLSVKLRYSFRMVSCLQMMSLGIYFHKYYPTESEVILRTMYKANGGFHQTFREEPLNIGFLVPTAVTAAACLLLYLGGYWLSASFRKKNYINYGDYLVSELFQLLDTFYYFHSKLLMYVIGVYFGTAASGATALLTTTPLVNIASLYLVLIVMTWAIVLCRYQRRTLHPEVYSKTFYIYTMFSPIPLLLIPLAGLTYPVYLCQLGLYIMIMVIGKHSLTRAKVSFYIVQLLCICLEIVWALLKDDAVIYYGFSVLVLFLLIFIAQVIYVVQFQKPQKVTVVNPNTNDTDNNEDTMVQLNQTKPNHQNILATGQSSLDFQTN